MPFSFGLDKVPQQVPRLLVIFVLAGAGFGVARHYLIPETFGELGHYRAAAIDSIAAHPISFAGQQECALCHSPVVETRMAGNHRGLSCEVCHGPAAGHVAAPMDTKPPAPRERALCPLCHSYDAARPTGFAQIDPVAHNPLTPCVTCHDPHAPEPPYTPEECSACHGQIARQKAVSHHAGLSCTTCHETPEGHKSDPGIVTPDKPVERAFCGSCHAMDDATSSRIPQVSLRSHNSGYLCWQCHYPHYPEMGDQ